MARSGPEIDEARLTQVMGNLASTKRALAAAIEVDVQAQYLLADRRSEALLKHEIAGKNVEEREADARRLLAPELAAVAKAEAAVRAVKLKHELAGLALEALRIELRLLELGRISAPVVVAESPPALAPEEVTEYLDECPF